MGTAGRLWCSATLWRTAPGKIRARLFPKPRRNLTSLRPECAFSVRNAVSSLAYFVGIRFSCEGESTHFASARIGFPSGNIQVVWLNGLALLGSYGASSLWSVHKTSPGERHANRTLLQRSRHPIRVPSTPALAHAPLAHQAHRAPTHTSALFTSYLARNTRAYTSARSAGFCAI